MLIVLALIVGRDRDTSSQEVLVSSVKLEMLIVYSAVNLILRTAPFARKDFMLGTQMVFLFVWPAIPNV